MSRDLYDVLGVPGSASEAEIRHAFHDLAKRYHPDVNHGDLAAAGRFVEVGNAAEVLLDPRRRASYDESRIPPGPVRPTAAPKPRTPQAPATPQPARTPQPPRTPPRPRTPQPPPAPGPASKPRESKNSRSNAVVVAVVAVTFAGMAVFAVFAPKQPPREVVGTPNGTLVWKTANFSLDDGWGIYLPGHGQLVQLLPGTTTDLGVSYGSLSSAGHIALLPPGETLTYPHCVAAVRKKTAQSEDLSAITPAASSRLCVSGNGGDLASVQVTQDDGSNLTLSITVWQYD